MKAQKHKDPFVRSRRLPDLSVGIGFNHNTTVKFKVPGGSLVTNVMYFDFDRRFLLGIDFTKNIDNRSSKIYIPSVGQQINEIGSFKRHIYNQTIFSLRGGWMLNDKFFFVVGSGLEVLNQFKEYSSRNDQVDFEVFYVATNTKPSLFYAKYGVMYKHNQLIFELFYSRRGIGAGINYFLSD